MFSNGRQPEFKAAVFIQVSVYGRTLVTGVLPLGAEEDAAGYRFSLTSDRPITLAEGLPQPIRASNPTRTTVPHTRNLINILSSCEKDGGIMRDS
jgi:hypothetical protein